MNTLTSTILGEKADELKPALKRTIEQVRKGKPALEN